MEAGPEVSRHRVSEPIGGDSPNTSKSWRLWTVLPLLLLGILLAATNSHFDILDDEVLMLNPATLPASQTVHIFMTGGWHYEHPPLPDLLLHAWWSVAPGSLFWLRLPFVVCYVLGFALFVAATRRLGGTRAAVALAWLALCSPFGFHFGRLLGWYSIGTLLVALVTYCYTRWLENDSPAWAAGTWVAGVGLLYTSYFAWVLLGFIALDAALFRRTTRWRAWIESTAGMLLFAVAFGPLWRAFFVELHHPQAKVEGSKLAAYIFDMYALLVSESFAPWFFKVAIPVALLCALCYLLTLLGSRGLPRRLLVYFLLATGLLALIGSINTKRLSFQMGWFFLAMAVALTQRGMPRLRTALMAAVAVVFTVGWFGTLDRDYYATSHFIDDWKGGVSAVLKDRTPGTVILYDNPVAAFYLSQALSPPSPRYVSFDNCATCAAKPTEIWYAEGHPGDHIVALRGVRYGLSQDPGDSYLEQNCKLESEQHYTRDTAAAMKRRLFPTQREPEWRISVDVYNCAAR
jgi:hypothetical protein